MEIQNTIKLIEDQLDDCNTTGQRRRYLLSYKVELENFLNKYPDTTTLPTSLELFCMNNPSAPECLKYDV
jgi:hypothetical protein